MSLGRLVVRLAVLVVVGWFAWQAYVHVTATLAINDRMQTVADRWQSNANAQADAAGGVGGVVVGGLEYTAEESNGWLPVRSYSLQGRILTLKAVYPTCARPSVVTDVHVDRDVLVVIVHDSLAWLPSKDRLFPPSTCGTKKVTTTARVLLGADLGQRVVVDGTTATSVPLA